MRRLDSDPGMTRIEIVVSERELLEVQSLLDAPTPSDAVRILISNRLAAERARRDEQQAKRQPRPMPEEPPKEFPQRQPSEEDWQERRENVGERRWRKSGPVVEDPSKKDEHPIRAYQRRMQEEQQHEQRARHGGSLERGNTGRPHGRPPGGGAPGARPGTAQGGGTYRPHPTGGTRPTGYGENNGPHPGGGRPRPGTGRPGGGGGRPGGRPEGGPPYGPRRGPRNSY